MCGHSVDLPGNTCSEYLFESHYKGDSNSTHYIYVLMKRLGKSSLRYHQIPPLYVPLNYKRSKCDFSVALSMQPL